MVTHMRVSYILLASALAATASSAFGAPPKSAPLPPLPSQPSATAPSATAPTTPAATAPTAPTAPAPAASAAPAPTTPATPGLTLVHHAPKTTVAANADVEVNIEISRPDLARRVLLVYRDANAVNELPFDRLGGGNSTGFLATIPAAHVHGQLAYAIEVENLDGSRSAAFATRDDMHPVAVMGDATDAREQALLDRNDHRRNVLMASGEYVHFGESDAPTGAVDPNTQQPIKSTVPDEYWRADAAYTYRFLRVVDEFGIRFGVVRGTQPTANPTKVGLNYGAPRLRLRANDWLYIDGEFLTSVTEVGFAVGAGGAFLIGDPFGVRLHLGVEGVQVFGVRTYARLDVPAGRRVLLSPTIEITNMPHAADLGMRLTLDMKVDLGKGFSVIARGGYMARKFTDVGYGGGLSTAYAF